MADTIPKVRDAMMRHPKQTKEQLLDEVCDLCLWPYQEIDEGQMQERCDKCQIEAMVQRIMEQSYKAGYAVGMVEAGQIAVRAAADHPLSHRQAMTVPHQGGAEGADNNCKVDK